MIAWQVFVTLAGVVSWVALAGTPFVALERLVALGGLSAAVFACGVALGLLMEGRPPLAFCVRAWAGAPVLAIGSATAFAGWAAGWPGSLLAAGASLTALFAVATATAGVLREVPAAWTYDALALGASLHDVRRRIVLPFAGRRIVAASGLAMAEVMGSRVPAFGLIGMAVGVSVDPIEVVGTSLGVTCAWLAIAALPARAA